MQDSIPIHRDTLKHWIYSDAEYFKVWVTMLAKARYLVEPKKGIYQNIHYTLNRGEFLYGRKKWNENTGVSEQKLRTLIKKLIKEEMLVNITTTSKFTIFLIVNYEKFNQHNNQHESEELQVVQEVNNQQDNQQLTSIQPASNQHLTTNKESNKKDKKAKTEKTNIYTAEFESFWTYYPKKEAKLDAQKAWNKIKLTDDLLIKIMDGLKKAKLSANWVKQCGQFIPNAATWLNGERWNDEVEEAQVGLFSQPTRELSIAEKAKQLEEDYERRHGIKTNIPNQRYISIVQSQ